MIARVFEPTSPPKSGGPLFPIPGAGIAERDQLVTLGFGGGPGPAAPGADYTGWQLARAFGASIHNHKVGARSVVIDAAADAGIPDRNPNQRQARPWKNLKKAVPMRDLHAQVDRA
jgi:hypothetical protein